MKESRRQLEAIFKPVLKQAGFLKHGATWHKSIEEAVLVLNLQSSEWSDDYYVNLGIYYKRLGVNYRPPESHCHVRIRLERLVDNRESFLLALDFEEEMDASARTDILTNAIIETGLPWLTEMARIEKLAEFLQQERNLFVHKDVRNLLRKLVG